MLEKPKKYLSFGEALAKLQAYCAYQDRCHVEIRQKLSDLGVYGEVADAVFERLIEDRFVDEERYAKSFARGKFRMKGWGKVRIKQALQQRQISAYCIKKALDEVDIVSKESGKGYFVENEADTEGGDKNGYTEKIIDALRTKERRLKENDPQKWQKMAAFALSKGFEADLVWAAVNEIRKL